MNKQMGETLSPEEFETLSKTLGLSDVEIAVAAAFADEDFEPVDCRDLAAAWRYMRLALGAAEVGDGNEAKDFLAEAGEIFMHIFDDFEYNEDGIYLIRYKDQLMAEIQGWAVIILKRLYGEPTHE